MEFVSHSLIKPRTVEYRLYQENLAKKSLEGNTLIVMPTALGKTVCATLVSAEILKKNPEAKVVFLAPTKPLALQHCNSMKKFLNFDESSFALFTGSTKISERKTLWENARIVSATPQTIRNDLERKRISLDSVGLLIVDETHRAVKRYSYVEVVKKYMDQAENPLIMGLTASPSIEKIKEICKNLFIKNIEVRTEEDPDVILYIQRKQVQRIYVELPKDFLEVSELLKNYVKYVTEKLKEMGFIYSSILRKKDILKLQKQLIEKKIYGGIIYSTALLKMSHALEIFETQGASQLYNYFEKMKKQGTKTVKMIMKNPSIARAVGLIEEMHAGKKEHPKIQKLKEIVQKELDENKRIIVFSHYRESAQKIVEELKCLENSKPVRFVGQATKQEDVGLKQKEQAEIIEKFRKGEYNPLIATAIGEEGLDIPEVDTVIFYEPVPSEIRKIQREGRTGRRRPGKVIVLITKKTRDESYYWTAHYKEKKMKKLLKAMKPEIGQKKLGDF